MGAVISSLLFQPPEYPTYTEHIPCEIQTFRTKSKVNVPFYYIEPRKKSNITVLYSHGNAVDIGCSYEFICILRDYLGVNVLHYEYFGYGLY